MADDEPPFAPNIEQAVTSTIKDKESMIRNRFSASRMLLPSRLPEGSRPHDETRRSQISTLFSNRSNKI
jgi:hypothetical protein